MSSGAFGDETESTVLHEVDCFGNETEILRCFMSSLGLQSEHSASVICQGVSGISHAYKTTVGKVSHHSVLVCCAPPANPRTR